MGRAVWECGAWNTLVETVVEGATPSGRTGWAGDKANIKTLAEVSVEEIPRFPPLPVNWIGCSVAAWWMARWC